ncbi:MAG: zinc ribbon domain-containing protein [Vicinamibacteria bacterium]|nr:zinc ribbon domain-containing protein [Vicinamibacteria bacterium]
MKVRHCPQCHTDYRSEIVHCADCGALLEDRDEEADVFGSSCAASGDDHHDERSTEGFESLCRAGDVHDLVPLADRLASCGVSFFIDEMRRGARCAGYRISVRSEERQRALDELAPLLSPGTIPVVLEQSFVEAEGEDLMTQCPACGEPLPESAFACPECGLPLREPEPRCPECAAPIQGDDLRCGNCGKLFDA